MKIQTLSVLLLLASAVAWAQDSKVTPCSQEQIASIRVEARERGDYPLFLLNEKKEAIGVVEVGYIKDAPIHRYPVMRAELCGTLEVSTFYYPDDKTAIMRHWVLSEPTDLKITQDEGWLGMQVVKQKDYANYIVSQVSYAAYDVFDNPDVPKATGVATITVPKYFLR